MKLFGTFIRELIITNLHMNLWTMSKTSKFLNLTPSLYCTCMYDVGIHYLSFAKL